MVMIHQWERREGRAQRLGISRNQLALLTMLRLLGGCTSKHLAQRVAREKGQHEWFGTPPIVVPRVHIELRPMERLGYVTSTPHTAYEEWMWQITAAGMAALEGEE